MTLRQAPVGATQGKPVTVDIAKVQRIGAWYVVEHQLRVLRNYRSTLIATTIGTPFIYLFAFGIGLASLVSTNLGDQAVDGVSYLAFVAPALICAATVTVATSEFTYPIMLGFKWNPYFIGMNSAPLSARQIMDGQVIFVILRMVLTGVFYYLVMLVFGAVPSAWGAGTVLAAVLAGLGFGTPLLAYSASVREDRGQFAPIWLTVIHVLYLVALAVGGWMLAVRIATRRLDK
jgi:lipooligosaccharide transport system permease protein